MEQRYKGKKLLVLGGAFQHLKVVEAAQKLGAVVYVADYLPHSPAKAIADKSFLLDIKDIDGIVEMCKKEQIDGVLSTSLDPCQLPYQAVCERLGLPCYGTKRQFHILTNKQAFKDCCKAHGVDTIPTYSAQALLEDGGQSGPVDFPVLVKPADSRGSRGQSVCSTRQELFSAIQTAKNESASGEVIVEKYMGGLDDFTMVYLFMEGDAHLVRTGDRYTGSRGEGLDGLAIAAECPSKHTGMYLEKVHPRVVHMLRSIGIRNGPVLMQGFIDGDTIRFYDPGFRLGGSEYERTFYAATGIDLIGLLVEFSLSGRFPAAALPRDIVYLGGKRSMQLFPALRPGVIKSVLGKDAICADDRVISFYENHRPGDEIAAQANVGRRFAEICLMTDGAGEERELVRLVQNTLRVEDEKGDDMICTRFDVSRL